jgi:hypothetical protein
MMLDYESVKDKPKTLRAMTSLDQSEFEELCNVFSEIWDEHTHQHEKDTTKGGRKPILKTIQDRLFFILFYLKVYPLQEGNRSPPRLRQGSEWATGTAVGDSGSQVRPR